jgi:hypothetical protein
MKNKKPPKFYDYQQRQKGKHDCGLVAVYNLLVWLDRAQETYPEFYERMKEMGCFTPGQGLYNSDVSSILYWEDVRSSMLVGAAVEDVEDALNCGEGAIIMFPARMGEREPEVVHYCFVRGHTPTTLTVLNPLDTGVESKARLRQYVRWSMEHGGWPMILHKFRR